MNRRDRDDLAVIPWALAGALLLLSHACEVDAQPREDEALLLARIVVSEAGWSGFETGDAHAIAYTLLGTAAERGVSLRAAARAHSPRATGTRETTDPRLSWVAGLRADLREPSAWPMGSHAPWSAYRARWADVLERSREVATWTLEDHEAHSICAVPPVTWAARWHEPSRGLVAIDCGDTLNRFFARAR
jgi:hypothetical protein